MTIGESVTSIGNDAFMNCSSLQSITSLAINPPSIAGYTFPSYSATLKVPAASVELYKSHSIWGDFSNIEAIVVKVTSVNLDQNVLSLSEGETATLTATVMPDDATDKSIVWSSSDSTVATVDEQGMITAIKAGTATITATTADGSNLSDSCLVTVEPKAKTISLILDDSKMLNSNKIRNYAIVQPATASQIVAWSSSDESVATIDASGRITAIAPGTTTITATTTDGSNLSASCDITVILNGDLDYDGVIDIADINKIINIMLHQ